MDVPVSLAIGSAYFASVWATLTNTGEIYFDSVVMFTFFLLLGRFLEMGARHKAGQVADELVRLLPQTATRINPDNSQTVVAANELALEDRVLVKPGETIPADGIIIDGHSSVNESLLTGESLPLSKHIDDEVIGGTLNVESPLTIRIKKLGDSTLLSSIIRLLDRAQTEKPDLAKYADKSAGLFVILLLLIATAVFVFWWFKDPSQAFWIALSVLVITCPCALSLATPAALTATTGNLTSKGVLTTRGHALETLAKVTHVVFDKTGTLTHGKHKLSCTEITGSLSEKECLDIVAGLEAASEHPLAKALTAASETPEKLVQLRSESGKGVEGKLNNKKYRVGSSDYVAEIIGDKLPRSKMTTDSHLSAVYFGRQGEWLAVLFLEDEIRTESKNAIKQLKALGLKVSLLSGDSINAVKSVAETLGIETFQPRLLPADKLNMLQKMQSQGYVVAMIGDGVNDAPVLAAANVSIAMGKGSQLAQASADMILLNENLNQLPFAFDLARRMQAVIRQNFSWAIVYNLVAIPIAAMGYITPWMAAIGMSLSSILVVLNALRLK